MTRRNQSRRALSIVALGALLAGAPMAPALASGTDHGAHASHGTPGAAAAKDGAMATGEVRRIDAAGGKLTIKHGEIANLDMPPMTMVFRVRDAALLQGLQQGDKIRFAAEKDGSQYVVVKLARE